MVAWLEGRQQCIASASGDSMVWSRSRAANPLQFVLDLFPCLLLGFWLVSVIPRSKDLRTRSFSRGAQGEAPKRCVAWGCVL